MARHSGSAAAWISASTTVPTDVRRSAPAVLAAPMASAQHRSWETDDSRTQGEERR
jgi:hypothetical protein